MTDVKFASPERRLDTRTRGTKQPAGEPVRVHVSDTPRAVVTGNVTVVDADGSGYATVFACDKPRPGTSNVNFVDGQTAATFVAVATDANGDLCVVASASAHLLSSADPLSSRFSSPVVLRGTSFMLRPM